MLMQRSETSVRFVIERKVCFMLCFCLAGIFIAYLPAVAQSPRKSQVQEFQQLETEWNQAQVRGDVEVLDALWADDLEVAVPRMPVMTKTTALNFARSGRMKFLRYQTSDIHVRVYRDAAVVTGRLQRSRTMNGKEVDDDWRFTKIYVRQAHKWRVASFHASEAAQP